MKLFSNIKIENILGKELFVSVAPKRTHKVIHLTDINELIYYQDLFSAPDFEITNIMSDDDFQDVKGISFYLNNVDLINEVESKYSDLILSKNEIKLNFIDNEYVYNFLKEPMHFYEIMIDVSDFKTLNELNPNIKVSLRTLQLSN